jgi:hypothetical protein
VRYTPHRESGEGRAGGRGRRESAGGSASGGAAAGGGAGKGGGGNRSGGGGGGGGVNSWDYWYSPQVKRWIRAETRNVTNDGKVLSHESWELVSFSVR